MKTTMDKAGRIVVPAALRERLGLVPGEVDITADGAGLRVEPRASEDLVEENGRLVIPDGESGRALTADDIGNFVLLTSADFLVDTSVAVRCVSARLLTMVR